MLFDDVSRFVALSKQIGVKGSDPGVKELMVTLRRSGFSSSQISELSGGKWSSTLIRQYTKGWGGVDENLDKQRNSLITNLRELASTGKDIKDVEYVLILDSSVKAKGSSLEEVAELNSNLRNIDLQRGEIGKLVTLSRELAEQQLTPNMVQGWLTIDQALVEDGFNKTTRKHILKASGKYGGVEGTLKAINEYNDLREIQRELGYLKAEVKRRNSEIDKLISVKEELDYRIDQKNDLINATNDALFLGFNTESLIMISVITANLGGPYKVVDAIHKYRSLKEMDEELETNKAELENVKKETSDQTHFLKTLNYTLDEAEKEYKGSSDVRMVVELLVNPLGIKMDKLEVVRLLTRVLASTVQRIDENPDILSIPSPAWDAIYEHVKVLADRLRSYSE